MLNKNGNIQTFIGCDAAYDDADVVIFGAPYDSTTSNRPGTRFAASAMRLESWGLETYSPYQDLDLTDKNIYDAGELELPFGRPEPALGMIEMTAAEIIKDGKKPLMIGGEHLVTLGAVRAAYVKYPDLRIIHLDAHTDLREHYLGERYPMQRSCAAAMTIWVMIGSFNLVYAVARAKSLLGPMATPICKSLI